MPENSARTFPPSCSQPVRSQAWCKQTGCNQSSQPCVQWRVIPARQVVKSLCLLILVVAGAAGQVSQFEGRPIVDIEFSPTQPLDPADLAKAQPLKKGDPLRAQDVAHAIDGLFATGRFEDIVVEAEPSGDGVRIRFVIKTTWFLGGVSVEGRVGQPPNRGQVTSAAELTLGAP